ncbi:MAG: M48 family metalloprotease [Pseudomonadota bacterium]
MLEAHEQQGNGMADGEQKPAEKPGAQSPEKQLRHLTNAELAMLPRVTDPELVAPFDKMVIAADISPKPVFVEYFTGFFPQASAGITVEGVSYVLLLSPAGNRQDKEEVLGLIAHELGHIKHKHFVRLPDLEQRKLETQADDVAMDLCMGRNFAASIIPTYHLTILAARESPLSFEEYALAHAKGHLPIDKRLEYLRDGVLAREASGQCPSPDGPSPTPNCKPDTGQGCKR